MWKVELKNYVWVEIDGKRELKKGSMYFQFDTLEEMSKFVEDVITHSDITEFSVNYVEEKAV